MPRISAALRDSNLWCGAPSRKLLSRRACTFAVQEPLKMQAYWQIR